tara:strand:- start:74 stop:217 length:144 start_codon:yes stop_codon:yes gene_type:complete
MDIFLTRGVPDQSMGRQTIFYEIKKQQKKTRYFYKKINKKIKIKGLK